MIINPGIGCFRWLRDNHSPGQHSREAKLNAGTQLRIHARIPGKMSGSPILVGGGIIMKGVVSRSLQNENHASGCLIAPMMYLPLVGDKSLLDLMNGGNEGIANMIGSGL